MGKFDSTCPRPVYFCIASEAARTINLRSSRSKRLATVPNSYANPRKAGLLSSSLVSVRKHFESFESFVIQSGDLMREGHHRCGRRRTADVTTAANCDIRVT